MPGEKSEFHGRELRLSRTLNAPIEVVWLAWTDPAHIAQWWGPTGFTNTISTMDFRPGGQWNLVMHGPDGTDYVNESIFREIVRHEKIVYEHISYPHILATITFEERGEQTLISWHMLFDSAEEFLAVIKKHNAAQGLKENLDKLGAFVSSMQAK